MKNEVISAPSSAEVFNGEYRDTNYLMGYFAGLHGMQTSKSGIVVLQGNLFLQYNLVNPEISSQALAHLDPVNSHLNRDRHVIPTPLPGR